MNGVSAERNGATLAGTDGAPTPRDPDVFQEPFPGHASAPQLSPVSELCTDVSGRFFQSSTLTGGGTGSIWWCVAGGDQRPARFLQVDLGLVR